MSFQEVESLENSFYRISSYIDYLELLAFDIRSVDHYQDYLYRAAFSIRINVDDYIANNCYLAMPGLILNINEGLFSFRSLTIEECLDATKGRLLRISSLNDKVHSNVVDILNKGDFYKEYSVKLIQDIANANVDNILIR